jgi:hypothetical protein
MSAHKKKPVFCNPVTVSGVFYADFDSDFDYVDFDYVDLC